MDTRIVAIGFVLAIIVSGAVGYLIRPNTNSMETTTRDSTQTSCSISGETIGVELQVVAINYSSHSTAPVKGASVNGQDVYYCNDSKETLPIAGASTNSTGWVNLSDGGGGIYYLNVSLPNSKLVYSLSIPVQPVTLTEVTFNVSTGDVTTRSCSYGQRCA